MADCGIWKILGVCSFLAGSIGSKSKRFNCCSSEESNGFNGMDKNTFLSIISSINRVTSSHDRSALNSVLL